MIGYQMFNIRQYARIRDECRLYNDFVVVFDSYRFGYFVRIFDLDDLLSLPHYYNRRLVFLLASQLRQFDYYKIKNVNTAVFFDILSELT